MTGFNHVLVGMAIAVVVRNPIAAPIAAFLSHFILDALPHYGSDDDTVKWERRFIRLLFLDGVLCFTVLALGILLFPALWWLLALCAFMATLPDWLWLVHYKGGVQHIFFDFHTKIQWGERPWGFWIEIPFSCLVVGLLFALHK
jgi:hypothetical protein